MIKNMHSNRRGGAGLFFVLLLLIVAFGGVAIVLLRQRMELKDKESQLNVRVADIQFSEDSQQKKLIESLQTSLNSKMKENADLLDQAKAVSEEEERLRKEIADKNNQIGFLVSERTRLETNSDGQVNLYQKEIDQLKKDKEHNQKLIEQERKKFNKKDKELSKEIASLKMELAKIEDEKAELVRSMSSLRESQLVKETAKMHFNLANHFLQDKQYDLAINEYNRALTLCPDDAEAHYNLALIYDIGKQDAVSAMEHYRKCLELDPKFKMRKSVQERLVALMMQESASISPTMATRDTRHDLQLDSINLIDKK